MPGMSERVPLERELPRAAGAALAIVRRLVDAGHTALLAGGCVRDLLLGREPEDYDVATDAPPERVRRLFRAARLVGAQFGVVLVRQYGRWVEVATFRSDGPYRDGRHPVQVTFSDARADAQRRDFTVNGMFLDPLAMEVADYVGGRADLAARLIRAIGDPVARFEEDHLRLLRAVRFAAKLDFAVESATLAAIRTHAAKLARVAPERVREELEKMLTHPARRRALELLVDTGLLSHLWRGATWNPDQVQAAATLLERLDERVSFEAAFAALVADRPVAEVHAIGRALAFSNEQRESVAWLVEHQGDFDDPDRLSLAGLKRLRVHRAFPALRELAAARPGGRRHVLAIDARLAQIPPSQIQPPPAGHRQRSGRPGRGAGADLQGGARHVVHAAVERNAGVARSRPGRTGRAAARTGGAPMSTLSFKPGGLPCLVALGAAVALSLAGCAATPGDGPEPVADSVKPVRLSLHLAYDEAREGCRKMQARDGHVLWVAPAAEFTQADIAAARVLRSDRQNMLQLVLRPFAARRLTALTQRECRRTRGVYRPEGPLIEVKIGAWLAVLVDGTLVCGLPIEYPVTTGEIYLVGVFSDERAEELAAALNPRGGP